VLPRVLNADLWDRTMANAWGKVEYNVRLYVVKTYIGNAWDLNGPRQ